MINSAAVREQAPRSVSRAAYNLGDQQLAAIERQCILSLGRYGVVGGSAMIAVEGRNPLANFGRTSEQRAFEKEQYDFHAGMVPYEPGSTFLFTCAVGEGVIAHVQRMVRARKPAPGNTDGLTGIEVIDDRLTSKKPEERESLERILAYHGITDVTRSVNLTSNLSTGRLRGVSPLQMPYGMVSYKGIVLLAQEQGIDNIFAYLNRSAQTSLARLTIASTLLAGRQFHLPMPLDKQQLDTRYKAFCIPVNAEHVGTLTRGNSNNLFSRQVAAIKLPVFTMGRDPNVLFQIA